jgi:hypothetical protein
LYFAQWFRVITIGLHQESCARCTRFAQPDATPLVSGAVILVRIACGSGNVFATFVAKLARVRSAVATGHAWPGWYARRLFHSRQPLPCHSR